MIYENELVLYAPDAADEFLSKEKAVENSYFRTIALLKDLRETNPEMYDEMIRVMQCIRLNDFSGVIYPYSVFMEYGIENNAAVIELLERQDRIIAIVRSEKNIANIVEALKHLEKQKQLDIELVDVKEGVLV